MSASGYNDKAKLADALELARSFKSGKNKETTGTPAPRGMAVKPPTRGKSQAPPGMIARAPMPSQRKYNGLGKFGTPLQSFNQTPLIGSAGLDFLSRRDQVTPAPSTTPQNAGQPSTGPVAAVSQPAPDSSNVQEATGLDVSAKSHVFEKRKPGGIAPADPGSLMDHFFTLVDEASNSPGKPTQAEESLIDFGEGDLISLETSEQQCSLDTDLLDSDIYDQSSTLIGALSTTPPRVEAGTTDGKTTEGKTRLSPCASDFVPAEAVTSAGNVETLPVIPWLSPMPMAGVPSMAYMVMVPMLGAAPFDGQRAFQAQPQMDPFAVRPSADTQAREMPSEAKRVRKLKGGLSTSKWAS